MLFLCCCGQENLRLLTKSCFVVKTDENNVEYIIRNIDELDKTLMVVLSLLQAKKLIPSCHLNYI